MDDAYETIQLGGEGRNVERLGTFVAWLVCNNMMDVSLERSQGTAIARVRLQDLSGPEFLTTVLTGVLRPGHLSDAGKAFVESYFVSGRYRDDYDACEYDGEDDWVRYGLVSPRITAAFRASRQSGSRSSGSAKILQFPGRGRDR